ncbi:DNA repair protein RecO [Shewanella sp. SR44-3]|uniref:DNA repair protein RecO n=1 Tax=Shewanella sp. SR44-3 TaxID=2760936 RepID=UPI0015F7E7C7|nr:DNA repair protein RecO [Shewanella sp. SR44-3]MBB1269842.1 DNA repair protein RecO [Shewanella sp. SR44-3]
MQRAYILHHRRYRESSVILNMLVDGVGRVDAMTRLGNGKRSIKSIVQPFQPLLVQFSSQSEHKSQGLSYIKQLEAAAPAMPLTGDSLYSGFYLNELLVRLLSVEHQGESLFVEYHRALMALAGEFNSATLRYFELALLKELGALPSLAVDVQGDLLLASSHYRFLADEGFLPVLQSAAGAFNHSKGILAGEMLIALNQGQLTESQLNQAKGLMRYLLTPLLGNKPLLSRQLFVSHKGK